MHLQQYETSQRFQATVVSSERITSEESPEEVREILLEIEDPAFDIAVGQNIGVLAPGQKEFGQEHHFRLYSLADVPERTGQGRPRFPICVRRCSYIDEYSGEEYRGVASNYLCDLRPGNSLTLTGPYEPPFEIPEDSEAALILIGAGTGIAPFRGFVKQLYKEAPDFKGRVWLFHGGRTGLDLLYMNEECNDFAQYYDKDTFEAIEALSHRPHWNDEIDWKAALESRGPEIWELLSNPHTQVYIAGLEPISDALDAVFVDLAGSRKQWERRKAELKAGQRWHELIY